MKLNIFLFLLLLPNLIIGQTNPPPAPAPAAPTPQEDFGTTQNSIVGTQSRSFGGGSIIKPNQILNSADFVLVGSPTYETFKFRPGTSLGWGKINQGKGYGINAVLTFDLSQQSYSFYRRNKNKYYHLNFGKLGMALNTGASITRVWELKNITLGSQLGVSIVVNGDKSNKDAYFVSVPYTVLIIQKEINLTNKKLKWKPEAFITLCSPYYDIGENFFDKSSTFNTVVGNNVSLKISKAFNFNICWRMNINTTPRWGVMNNILLGTTLGF
jgi:hypothetical protein